MEGEKLLGDIAMLTCYNASIPDLVCQSATSAFSWPHRGFTTIVIAHIAFCTAYVTVTVQSRLQSADRSLE